MSNNNSNRANSRSSSMNSNTISINTNQFVRRNKPAYAMPAVSSNSFKAASKKATVEKSNAQKAQEKLEKLMKLQEERAQKAQERKAKLEIQKAETEKGRLIKLAAKKTMKGVFKNIQAMRKYNNDPAPEPTRKKRAAKKTEADILEEAKQKIAALQMKQAQQAADRLLREQKAEEAKEKRKQERLEKKQKEQEEAAKKAMENAEKQGIVLKNIVVAAKKTRRSSKEVAEEKLKRAEKAAEKVRLLEEKAKAALERATQTKKKIKKVENGQIAAMAGVANQVKEIVNAAANGVLAGTKKKSRKLADQIEEARRRLNAATTQVKNLASNAGVVPSKSKRAKKPLDEKCAAAILRIQKAQDAYAKLGCAGLLTHSA